MAAALVKPDLPPALRQADALPSLPMVALEVLRLTQDEDTTIEDLAATIEKDPALTAKLLKLANSSLFNPGKEIATLQRATMVLGMKTVKLLSLSFSLVGSLPSEGVHAGFDFGHYWRRSLTAAVAGRSLARIAGLREADEIFLVGLLGHLGKLVLSTCLAEEYAPLVARGGGWPTPAEERAALGFDSTDVGATLLHDWDLPTTIYVPVGHAERPEDVLADVDERLHRLLWVCHCTRLAEEVLCGSAKGSALERLHAVGEERLGLGANDLDAFLLGLEAGIAETADLLDMALPDGRSHDDLLNEARLQMVQVSLGAAMDLQQARRRTLQLEDEKRQLQSEAKTDALTGLANRKAFDDFLQHHVDERVQGQVARALGLVLVDVDHFKRFNDTYGHQAGDEVLRMVGRTLERLTRGGDLAARYGGEEFAVIAPQTTPFGIKTLAERLRQAIEETTVEFEGQTLSVTASFGCACIAQIDARSDARVLVKLADHYLYKAKEAGRNRCETYPKVQFPGR